MADQLPEFEIEDINGSNDHYNGAIGVTAAPLPAVAGNVIAAVYLVNKKTNTPQTRELYLSLDGGTTFITLFVGDDILLPVRGNRTQIHIKANAAGVNYECILYRQL